MAPVRGSAIRIALAVLFILGAAAAWGQWLEIPIQPGESVWASSSLVEQWGGRRIVYGPENLFDGDIATSWSEGAEGPGVGEDLLVLTQRPIEELRLVNGYASDAGLFLDNNRVKSLDVSIVAGLTAPGMVSETDWQLYFTRETVIAEGVLLDDAAEEQVLSIEWDDDDQYNLFYDAVEAFQADEGFLFSMICKDLGVDPENTGLVHYARDVMEFYGFYAVRLRIAEVYPGRKYDDTCLTELAFELGEF